MGHKNIFSFGNPTAAKKHTAWEHCNAKHNISRVASFAALTASSSVFPSFLAWALAFLYAHDFRDSWAFLSACALSCSSLIGFLSWVLVRFLLADFFGFSAVGGSAKTSLLFPFAFLECFVLVLVCLCSPLSQVRKLAF